MFRDLSLYYTGLEYFPYLRCNYKYYHELGKNISYLPRYVHTCLSFSSLLLKKIVFSQNLICRKLLTYTSDYIFYFNPKMFSKVLHTKFYILDLRYFNFLYLNPSVILKNYSITSSIIFC